MQIPRKHHRRANRSPAQSGASAASVLTLVAVPSFSAELRSAFIFLSNSSWTLPLSYLLALFLLLVDTKYIHRYKTSLTSGL